MVIKDKLRNDIPSILIWGIISFLLPIKFFYKDEAGFTKAITFIWNSDKAIKKFIAFILTVLALIFSRICYYTAEKFLN